MNEPTNEQLADAVKELRAFTAKLDRAAWVADQIDKAKQYRRRLDLVAVPGTKALIPMTQYVQSEQFKKQVWRLFA